jgi:sn-glycerol 3-phosphate transport system ATP-binding protein
MATLELSGLRKSFGATPVLHGIDLTLVDGEMLVIVGASGCGKSTLLRLVAGLERASAGRILLDGRDITDVDPSSRDIAMVFQNYALYPHMSVFDNMAYGLRIRGLSRMEIAEKVDEAAAMLGLGELLARKPRQLSGGQRQRVAKLRVQMRAEIRHLQRRLGVTSLYVTHDQVEAMTLGDRLLVLHQGRPAQLATPMEVFDRPADTYVAGFIGAPAMNFLPAVLTRGGTAVRLEAGPEITFLDGSRPGLNEKKLTIGIRPEHLILDDDGLALVVDLIEPLGSETLVHARLAAPVNRGAERGAGGPIVIKLSGHAPVEWVEEKRIGVRLDPSQLHVFDAATGRRLEPGNCRDSALPA